jgi:hypothetical protein
MTTNGEFDHILDEALAEYRDAEPLAGIEERVLYRLQQDTRKRKLRWVQSLAAGLASILLIVGMWLSLRHESAVNTTVVRSTAHVPNSLPSSSTSSTALEAYGQSLPQQPQQRAPRLERHDTRKEVSTTPPMRDRFPTPAPPTPAERALLALADATPQALRTLPQGETEIAIAPIEIKPLADEHAGSQGEN